MTDSELQHRVLCEVARCMAIARTRWPALANMAEPVVDFKLKRKALGMAWLNANRVSINMAGLRVDPEHVIGQTVAHEVAHLVHHALVPADYFKGTRQHHGRNWQGVMHAFGIADPLRVYKATPEVCAAMGLKPTVRRPRRPRHPRGMALLSQMLGAAFTDR